MDDQLTEIIGDLRDASRSLDSASERAKKATLTETHQAIESIWADLDVLFKKLSEQNGAAVK